MSFHEFGCQLLRAIQRLHRTTQYLITIPVVKICRCAIPVIGCHADINDEAIS